MKKKILKGFTLVELIIVMAVFSILMLGAMSLIGPVSKIFKHTNDLEKTYSYVNNIQNYLQYSLQYADNAWVYQGDLDQTELSEKAFAYKDAFYKDIISTKDGSAVNYSKCTIRVMTILNKDTEIGGITYQKGQILLQDVTYSSDAAAKQNLSACTKQLNDTFFSDKYDYDYILGASNFVKSGNGVMVANMAKDVVGNVAGALNESNFSIGIVTYDTSTNSDGSSKFSTVTDIRDSDNAEYNYRIYDSSSQYSVANIPMLNIIERNGNPNKSYYVYGKAEDGITTDTSKAEIYNPSGTSFDHNPDNISMSADDNIYIIYSLCDEVNVPQ